MRKDGTLPYLRPDGKTQVTVRYEQDAHGRIEPVEIVRLLISTQHAEDATPSDHIKPDLIEHVIEPVLPADLVRRRRGCARGDFVLVNPTGRFVIGGPHGDTGLTGRKIIVDTYGGMARHGGGAFRGKDPTKVDRSAAYAARWVAKNVVAAGLADRCEVQVAYAIGVAHPMSVMVETFGTERGVTADAIARRRPRDVRPAPGRDPRATSTCAARSTADGGLRPLRPRPASVGAHRPRRRAARRRRARRHHRLGTNVSSSAAAAVAAVRANAHDAARPRRELSASSARKATIGRGRAMPGA